jgi:hypothetical protein
MRRIGRLAVGGVVAVALIVGLTGAATAASSTTTGASGNSKGAPATSLPITTSPTITTPPSTSSPSTTPPSTTSPTATSPSKKAKAKKGKGKKKAKIMTGAEIWAIVTGHHSVNCQRAPKELKRVQAAVQAASTRLGRWQKAAARTPKSTAGTATTAATAAKKAKKAKAASHREGKREKYFQNLQKHGAALIKRIDSKCGGKTSTS